MENPLRRQLHLLDKIERLSQHILLLAEKKNDNEIEFESINRGRLINIIRKENKKIRLTPKEKLSKELQYGIKQWEKKLNEIQRIIPEIDKRVLDQLKANKNEIQENLSLFYKKKLIQKKYTDSIRENNP